MAAVLIISAVVMAVVATVVMLAIGEGQSALALDLGTGDRLAVDGCVEDLLQKVHDNAAYSGVTVTHGAAVTCQFSYNLGGPVNWDVVVSETGTGFGNRVRVVFTREQSLVLTSWSEI